MRGGRIDTSIIKHLYDTLISSHEERSRMLGWCDWVSCHRTEVTSAAAYL